jgi:hypothetical protein
MVRGEAVNELHSKARQLCRFVLANMLSTTIFTFGFAAAPARNMLFTTICISH